MRVFCPPAPRRPLVGLCCAVLATLACSPAAQRVHAAEATASAHVDAARLNAALAKLSEFGRNAEGGVTRLGFSEADLAAREYVQGLMRQAGLEVRVDPAGNIFGRRNGSAKLPTLLVGSHIDSVPHGGNFDGDVGSLSAIEVMRALQEHGVQTRHPLAAVVWTNEEGVHFGLGTQGSAVASGDLGPEILTRTDAEGRSVADWLRRYGQDPARLTEARIARGALAGYLELHIEQGPVLDEQQIPLGVVQGIVGLKRWTCTTTGVANHAGTTPMNRRHDALLAAARAALIVREVVRAEPGTQVGTVGYLTAVPGAMNVVAGHAEFPVELRDLDDAKVDRLWGALQPRFAAIDREEGVTTHCELTESIVSARTDPAFQGAIREAAQSLGLATLDLPSGAVHDAQNMARLAPIGMIFVPSRGGVSHAPQEFTSAVAIADGAEVLYRTVLLLDQRLDRK